MLKIKKLILASVIFASCLYVSNMVANYVFVQDTSADATGEVEVKDRSYEVNNIVLTAGYSDTSCNVQDFDGNDISSNQEGIKNFFVEDEDITDDYGNHFVQLKKYYVNMSQDDTTGVITYKLSHTKVDNTYFVCPYFYDKDGNEIEYAYYGKYKGYYDTDADTKVLRSTSGHSPIYSATIDDCRTFARNNGDEYHQTDWCAVFTAQIMYMCCYKTTNSDINKNCRSYSSATGAGETYETFGIEDLVGNGLEFVDGVVFRGGSSLNTCSVSWADKISDYAANITTNQTILNEASGTSGLLVTEMYCTNGKPALSIFPKKVDGTNSQQFYADKFWFYSDTSARVTQWGSLGLGNNSYGIFCVDCASQWSSSLYYLGSRLHTKKLYKTITLEAGNENASCTVKDVNGNDLDQNVVKNFFVANEDVTDSNGNHFVQLNKYYINMSQDDTTGVITYKLSNKKEDDTYFVCPYFLDKDGNEIEYAYYGKYKGYYDATADTKVLRSISGVKPTYSTNIDNYRTYARNNGDQYHQTDWCAVFTAQIMFMCTYKTTDISKALTYRTYGSQTGKGTEILGIEDLVGNGYEDVDGVVFRTDGSASLAGSSVSYADKISDYAANITTHQTTLTGATGGSGNYISKMYYSNGQPALSLFPKEINGSSSTYYCDRFYYSTSNRKNLTSWGAYGSNDTNGLFFMDCNFIWSDAYGYMGSRLHTKILG